MVDRTALLLPRFRLSNKSYSDVLDDTLHHLRIGHAIGRIRQTIGQIEGEIGDNARALLSAIAAHFGAARPTGPVEGIGLDQRIETLTMLIAGSPNEKHSLLLDLLIDLRFALNPSSTADAEIGS